MLFYRVAASNPERVFVLAKNSIGDSVSNGYWVRWDYSTDQNGISFEKPAAKPAPDTAGVGHGISIAGVVAHTITDGSYGLIQVYGFHPAARVKSDGTDIAKGTALGAGGNVYYALPVEVTGTNANAYPIGFSFEVYTQSGTSTTKKVFVKCL